MRFFVHNFQNIENAGFSASDYSKLKFGSDSIAKKFGYELAERFADAHLDVLIAKPALVIPSPYNHVKNAATILSEHFVNRLNQILVPICGRSVEADTIRRYVSYINDYGFLSKEQRRDLINQDKFYLNKKFYRGKLLIFIDDVRITGTHEDKLIDILEKEKVKNDRFFLYYANYSGENPEIEAKINFAGVRSLADYVKLAQEPNHHVIVRPLKYLLAQNLEDLEKTLNGLNHNKLETIYCGCLAEGYFKIPTYQENVNLIGNLLASR